MADLEDPAALVGAVLNRKWRLTRVIGQGGLALVFEASAEGTGPAAVKLLRREFCDEPPIVERFLAEATAGERVSHPGVARVFEAARAEDGTPYLVMELLSGMPLASRMNQGPMPVAEVVTAATGVLDAIAEAHRAGVVHRDLKPDNVFVSSGDDGSHVVKVLDFGLARVMDEAGGMGRKTKTGMVLGTPGYMGPEQIHNAKEADPRCDLWSIGVIIYEMLTGRPAFTAETEMARVTAVLTTDPTPIEQAAPQFAHWASFFKKALARDVRERFQSADEMKSAMLAASRGESPAATAADAAPAAPAPAAPFGGVPTAVSASMPEGYSHSEAPPNVEVVSPARRSIPLMFGIALLVLALVVGVAIGVVISVTQ